MNLTKKEKIEVLFNEFFTAKEFLISINQDTENELDKLTKFYINRALFHCQPFIKDSSFDYRTGIAYLDYNKILFNIDSLNFEIDRELFEPECLVIHEISHLLLYYFSLLYNHKKITEHNLEFVIFSYCLFYRYTKTIYKVRAYDIQDEKDLDKLNIDFDKFIQFIMSIKFKNLNELYLKTVHYSNKIRQKKPKTFLDKIIHSLKTFLRKPRA